MNDYSVPNQFDFERHRLDIINHRNKRYNIIMNTTSAAAEHEQLHNRSKRISPVNDNRNQRYILFILDSSGSIGRSQFNTIKEVLSNLLPLFCGYIKFGVMSYGAIIERDICFDCDQSDRHKVMQALQSIEYHSSSSTRSGDAIRCACDFMLSRRCGYRNKPHPITDVIFLTDGHFNQGEDPCIAAECFPNAVNVISIGIGNNIDYDELECIKGDNAPSHHIFDVKDIAGLKELQIEVLKFLRKGANAKQSNCIKLPL